jgi:hypothetical protein
MAGEEAPLNGLCDGDRLDSCKSFLALLLKKCTDRGYIHIFLRVREVFTEQPRQCGNCGIKELAVGLVAAHTVVSLPHLDIVRNIARKEHPAR